MDDRTLVTYLIQLGVAARRRNANAYATPSDDPQLRGIGPATIANWLEELGRHRLIGDVQPHFSTSGAGFRYQVTENADRLLVDQTSFNSWLDKLIPIPVSFDLFISYATGDSAFADELRIDLQQGGLKCFMAEKDIQVAKEWQDSIRDALRGSKQILVLLTPRSINRPWVLMETGAAWALGKSLIPALVQVPASELIDPIRRHQARVIETTAQRKALVTELTGK